MTEEGLRCSGPGWGPSAHLAHLFPMGTAPSPGGAGWDLTSPPCAAKSSQAALASPRPEFWMLVLRRPTALGHNISKMLMQSVSGVCTSQRGTEPSGGADCLPWRADQGQASGRDHVSFEIFLVVKNTDRKEHVKDTHTVKKKWIPACLPKVKEFTFLLILSWFGFHFGKRGHLQGHTGMGGPALILVETRQGARKCQAVTWRNGGSGTCLRLCRELGSLPLFHWVW